MDVSVRSPQFTRIMYINSWFCTTVESHINERTESIQSKCQIWFTICLAGLSLWCGNTRSASAKIGTEAINVFQRTGSSRANVCGSPANQSD